MHPQRNELFEVLRFRIRAARLPLRHRAPGDAKPVSQSRLHQADVRPQRQYHLTEGIVVFTIRGPLHRRSPFRVTQQSETMQSNEK